MVSAFQELFSPFRIGLGLEVFSLRKETVSSTFQTSIAELITPVQSFAGHRVEEQLKVTDGVAICSTL